MLLQVIKELTNAGSQFRVLALSATPGNDLRVCYSTLAHTYTHLTHTHTHLTHSHTPSSQAVQQVVTNLQVGQIELRSEDSFDIQRYVHERKVEKIVVALEGEILETKNAFLKVSPWSTVTTVTITPSLSLPHHPQVLSGVVSRLSQYRLLYHSHPDRLGKFQILQARDQFRLAGPPQGVHVSRALSLSLSPSLSLSASSMSFCSLFQPGTIEGDFALAISLYHAYELLQQHGLRSFYQFLSQTFSEGHSRAKMEVTRSQEFVRIMRNLEEKFSHRNTTDGPNSPRHLRSPKPSASPRVGPGVIAPQPFFYSHPKLKKLEEVVLSHFRSHESSTSNAPSSSVNTRVMIFSQYRESVQEIADMLMCHAPLVRVMSFVGHSSSSRSTSKGLTQKEQTEVGQLMVQCSTEYAELSNLLFQ